MFLAIDLNKILHEVIAWISTSGVKLIIGLVVLLIVFKIINCIASRVKRRLEKRNVDKTISSVTHTIIRKGGKLVVFIMFLGYVGIDTAAIGSIIGSVGVAIGLAVQGSLSNLAGGIVILVMRPFRIGDYIIAQGAEGTVEEIRMFYTYIVTNDNRVVMLPNGALANGKIENTSLKNLRRVDLKYYIPYADDLDKAKEVLLKLAAEHDLTLDDPAASVSVSSFARFGVEICVTCWTKKEDYWTVYSFLNNNVKKEFENNGIRLS